MEALPGKNRKSVILDGLFCKFTRIIAHSTIAGFGSEHMSGIALATTKLLERHTGPKGAIHVNG